MTQVSVFGAFLIFSPIEFRCYKQFLSKQRKFHAPSGVKVFCVLILYILIIIMNFSLVNLNFYVAQILVALNFTNI